MANFVWVGGTSGVAEVNTYTLNNDFNDSETDITVTLTDEGGGTQTVSITPSGTDELCLRAVLVGCRPVRPNYPLVPDASPLNVIPSRFRSPLSKATSPHLRGTACSSSGPLENGNPAREPIEVRDPNADLSGPSLPGALEPGSCQRKRAGKGPAPPLSWGYWGASQAERPI